MIYYGKKDQKNHLKNTVTLSLLTFERATLLGEKVVPLCVSNRAD
jgi:hypothetical protein